MRWNSVDWKWSAVIPSPKVHHSESHEIIMTEGYSSERTGGGSPSQSRSRAHTRIRLSSVCLQVMHPAERLHNGLYAIRETLCNQYCRREMDWAWSRGRKDWNNAAAAGGQHNSPWLFSTRLIWKHSRIYLQLSYSMIRPLSPGQISIDVPSSYTHQALSEKSIFWSCASRAHIYIYIYIVMQFLSFDEHKKY